MKIVTLLRLSCLHRLAPWLLCGAALLSQAASVDAPELARPGPARVVFENSEFSGLRT